VRIDSCCLKTKVVVLMQRLKEKAIKDVVSLALSAEVGPSTCRFRGHDYRQCQVNAGHCSQDSPIVLGVASSIENRRKEMEKKLCEGWLGWQVAGE
jgi:hypothetical protein